MNLPKNKVLIVGGGIGGMCAAIELRKLDFDVDIVEIDPYWTVYGAGITISGPTLRALRSIGVHEEVLAQGGKWQAVDICAPDGSVLNHMPLPPTAGAEDMPRAAGILRPILARILSKATLASGAEVRLGTSFQTITQDHTGVDVVFTDGSTGRYDFLIGADGVNSKVREAIFPGAPVPKFTGQGSWRAIVPRTVEHSTIFMGATTKAGINPVSDTEAYLYCLDQRDHFDFIPQEQWPVLLAQLLTEFGGVVGEIRVGLECGEIPAEHIVYRPLAGLMMSGPWHLGRVVLLGDTCHATTPHLASGAGIAIEDAVVLAEELRSANTLDEAFNAYVTRRYERAKLVVESSMRLGEIEQTGGSKEEHTQIIRSTMMALAEPI